MNLDCLMDQSTGFFDSLRRVKLWKLSSCQHKQLSVRLNISMAKKKDKISITEFQSRGGKSRSPKKIEAVRNNLAKARAVMAERRRKLKEEAQ